MGAGGLARAYGAATRAALVAGEFAPLQSGNGEGAGRAGDREGGGDNHRWLRVELAHQQAYALRTAVERASRAPARATDAGAADIGGDNDGDIAMSRIYIQDIEFGQHATATLSAPKESIGDVCNLLRGVFHARRVDPSAAPALASVAATDAETSVDITFDL